MFWLDSKKINRLFENKIAWNDDKNCDIVQWNWIYISFRNFLIRIEISGKCQQMEPSYVTLNANQAHADIHTEDELCWSDIAAKHTHSPKWTDVCTFASVYRQLQAWTDTVGYSIHTQTFLGIHEHLSNHKRWCLIEPHLFVISSSIFDSAIRVFTKSLL